MNEKFSIESESFSLSLEFQVFVKDIPYPSNTILSVFVSSNGFSASTTMDIDIKEIFAFCDDLYTLYHFLSGNPMIKEPFGNQQYISFVGNKRGHVTISGVLISIGLNGCLQELKFENVIDQSFLPDFIQQLTVFSKQFCDRKLY